MVFRGGIFKGILQGVGLFQRVAAFEPAGHGNKPRHIGAADQRGGGFVADQQAAAAFLVALVGGVLPFGFGIAAVAAERLPQLVELLGQLGKREGVFRLPVAEIDGADFDRCRPFADDVVEQNQRGALGVFLLLGGQRGQAEYQRGVFVPQADGGGNLGGVKAQAVHFDGEAGGRLAEGVHRPRQAGGGVVGQKLHQREVGGCAVGGENQAA